MINRRSTACASAALVAVAGVATAQCETQQVTATDASAGDFLGYRAVLSDTRFAVGAPRVSDVPEYSGAVYVFEIGGTSSEPWSQVAKLTASDAEGGEQLGIALDMRGDTILAGAHLESRPEISGAAYIFERQSDGSWLETKKLKPDDTAAGDLFGFAVALEPDIAVIGSVWDDDLGAKSGAVYVYDRNLGGPDAWGFVDKLLPNDGAGEDEFGHAVALDGNTLLVGARGDDIDGVVNAGSAYVFVRDPEEEDWLEVDKLKASDPAEDQFFGFSVDLAPFVAVVGAPHRNITPGTGAVYVFERDHDGWSEVAKLEPAEPQLNDSFGRTVKLSGSTLLVGAPERSDAADRAGAVYVYQRSGGVWSFVTKIIADDVGEDSFFGAGIGLDGDQAVLGAIQVDGGDVGRAYVYDIDPCAGDLTDDGEVDLQDLLVMLSSWGSCPAPPDACPADTDDDDDVDTVDMLTVLAAWGPCCE